MKPLSRFRAALPFMERTTARRSHAVDIGQSYAPTANNDTPGTRLAWRVDRLLPDGVHVRLARTGEPGTNKTVSLWALTNLWFAVPPQL